MTDSKKAPWLVPKLLLIASFSRVFCINYLFFNLCHCSKECLHKTM